MTDSKLPPSAPPRIAIERRYRARVDELWDLWTTKDGFESWWGPQGFRVEVHAIDARPGGVLRYDMIADAPDAIAAMRAAGEPLSKTVQARFSTLELHRHLELTSVIDFLPGVAAYDNTIAVDFASDGDFARMRVTLEPLHTDLFSRMQEAGFTSQLGKLDARFATT